MGGWRPPHGGIACFVVVNKNSLISAASMDIACNLILYNRFLNLKAD